MVIERAEQGGTLAITKFGYSGGKLLQARFDIGALLKDLGRVVHVEAVRNERATIVNFAFLVERQRLNRLAAAQHVDDFTVHDSADVGFGIVDRMIFKDRPELNANAL